MRGSLAKRYDRIDRNFAFVIPVIPTKYRAFWAVIKITNHLSNSIYSFRHAFCLLHLASGRLRTTPTKASEDAEAKG